VNSGKLDALLEHFDCPCIIVSRKERKTLEADRTKDPRESTHEDSPS
jgi:hypothetical protein